MTEAMDRLTKRLDRATANAAYQKARYHRIRNEAIAVLGGKCNYCNETDPAKLEIHHIPPLVWSVKRNGFTRGERSGEARIRWFRDIIAGKCTAGLSCKEHHVNIEHGGNTCALKKGE